LIKVFTTLRKQIYPHEYLDSECKFTEEQLPPIEAVHSSVSGEYIPVEDYAHAQKIWEELHI
jgi:hypothetical protein